MDLSTLLEFVANRQPVVWIATGAIALGAACLAAALFQFGRTWHRRHRSQRRQPVPATLPAAAPAPAVNMKGDLYQPAGVLRVPTATGDDAPSFALLLRRLRAAGDRLEGVAADLDSLDMHAPESFLKDVRPEVEYVFRASGA